MTARPPSIRTRDTASYSVQAYGARAHRTRIARIGLIVYVGLIALSVLPSVSPMFVVRLLASGMRDAGAWFVRDGWIEFAMNIAMFVPLSALVILSVPRIRPVLSLLGVCTVAVLIEMFQILLPGRVASVRDIFANCVGAAIGYAVTRVIVRRDRRR